MKNIMAKKMSNIVRSRKAKFNPRNGGDAS